MANVELDIIRLFSQKSDVELTIHQISKNLKKSYAFTNKYAHDMLKQDILKKKVVGNAILCSLNKDNEKLLGLLVMNSISKKMQFEHSLKNDSKVELSAFIRSLDEKIVFISGSTITIISDKQLPVKKILGFKVNISSYDSFIKNKGALELSDVIVLKNHEQFWSMIYR
jgi:hypothetical protein